MMQRRRFMQMGLGLGAVLGDSRTHAEGSHAVWINRTFNGLGTSMTLRLAHAVEQAGNRAMDAAIACIRQVEDLMSLFRPDSAICQLNRQGVLRNPHPDLVQILRIAQDVSRRSQGAFDVTVQPLWLAYDKARTQGRLPDAREIAAARARVGWKRLHVSDREIRFTRAGMGITLNGIAQGFAADKVCSTLKDHGVMQALIDTGEYASLGQPDPDRDWTLGVAHPRDAHAVVARLAMRGRCVATSADDQCSFSPDFVHHHIFDPHTGQSPTQLSCVSVMAPSCVMADAITKVLFMSNLEQAMALAHAWEVDALVVDKAGHWRATSGVPLITG